MKMIYDYLLATAQAVVPNYSLKHGYKSNSILTCFLNKAS